MDCDPHLHALVIGTLIAHLRERRGLSQAKLAESAAIATSTMSRIEKGQGAVDVLTLDHLARALHLQSTYLVTVVSRACERIEKMARQLFKLPPNTWWSATQGYTGTLGAAGLVSCAVGAVLVESPPQ